MTYNVFGGTLNLTQLQLQLRDELTELYQVWAAHRPIIGAVAFFGFQISCSVSKQG